MPDFTKECHFAELFPKLDDELSIFMPTNYRSRHSETVPNWQNLQGYTCNAVQKTWFCGQMQKEDLVIDYRLRDTKREFCARYGIPHSTVRNWIQRYVSERKDLPKHSARNVPRFIMNHDRPGRPDKISPDSLLEAFKEIEEGSATERGGEKNKKSHLEDHELRAIFKRYEHRSYNLSFLVRFFNA